MLTDHQNSANLGWSRNKPERDYMYITRHIEHTVIRLSEMFGAVLVTGPRQVGKSTMLQHVTSNIPYLTLDDPMLMQAASQEPGSFFHRNLPPIVVDEIQYAPELFPYVKMILDETKGKGLFYFSGSQQFQMMKNVSESLAGRLGIVEMLGLSLREINGVEFYESFVPTEEYLAGRSKHAVKTGYNETWKTIHRGSMPELFTNRSIDWQNYYSAYVRTYLERDVRDLAQVGDTVAFLRFTAAVASMTGKLLNIASLARDVGISYAIAQHWLSVLVASGIVFLLPPYFNNAIKRAVKTPKVYFLDTGLAAYLTKWSSFQVLEAGAESGAFFETFVIAEIIKSYRNAGKEPPIYFYRDRDGKEIDLLMIENGYVHPIEIKKTANPNSEDIKQFKLLDRIEGLNRGSGGIVCMYEKLLNISGEDLIIPVSYL